MSYSEAAYFDGNHCQHVAAWEDDKWNKYRRNKAVQAVCERRRNRR